MYIYNIIYIYILYIYIIYPAKLTQTIDQATMYTILQVLSWFVLYFRPRLTSRKNVFLSAHQVSRFNEKVYSCISTYVINIYVVYFI